MLLVILTAVLAVSEAANIGKRYISPFSTWKSGGLFSPFGSFGIESPAVPSGGYTNDDLGVVVDAVAPGTRTSGVEATGLGGPRTSYGSLDSKVGDAAFKVGGGAVKGTAPGISSLFGPGIDQEAHIGLPGIGFGSGSSSLEVVGKKPAGAQVTDFGVSKTTYESTHPSGGDVALGVENAAIKGGATGSGSILSSGSSQSNLGLPGIGFGSGSSSLDVVGEKPSSAQLTGFGVSKTTYESTHPSGGDVALGVENAAIKGGATGSGSILSSGSSQSNLGLPGIGFGSGSSSLDVVGEKPSSAQLTGFGVSKTTYESIHPTGGDVALGVENTAVKGDATGSGSILSSGSSQANLGLSAIGFGSGSSSLDAVEEKPTGAQVSGFGVSKTTFESIHPSGGDVALGVENAAIKGGATGSGSILSSGSSKSNLGLPGIGFGSGSSSSDVVGEKPSGAQVTGFGVSKTTYESIHPTGGDVALGVENAAIKGGATGSGSILSSGSSQSNLGLPGIGFGSGSSSLDVVGEKPSSTQLTGFGVSKTTHESIHPSGGDVALGVENAAVKGGATGSGSILSSGSSQANLGLSGIGFGSGSSSLDAVEEKPTGAQVSGFGVSKTTYESIHPTGGDVVLGVENAAIKGGATGSGSILSSGSSQSNLGLPGIGFGSGSSSLDVVGEKPTGAQVTGFGVSKTTYESIHPTGGDVALSVQNVAVKEGATGSGSIFSSGSNQANLGLPGIGFGAGSSSLDVVGEKPTGAQVTSLGKSKTSFESINSKGGDAALNIENEEVKGGSAGVSSVFDTSSGQEAKIGLTGIGIVPASSALDVSGKVTGSKVTGLGVSKTTYESIDSTGGDAPLNIEKAAVKGGTSIIGYGTGQVGSGISSSEPVKGYEGVKIPVTKFDTEAPLSTEGDASGVYSVFGSGSSQKADIPKADLASRISALGTVEGYENDKIHAQKFAHNIELGNLGLPEGKGGASEIASAFGSSKQLESELPSLGLGSRVISSGIVEGYENDKIHAQKFANNAALSAKGEFSGVSSVFGSGSSQKANTGLPNIGVLPGYSSFETSGVKTSGAELTSFDPLKTSHSSTGSKVGDAAITIADASLKVSAAGVDSLFGPGIGEKENVELPGIGVLPGVSSSEVLVEGYKNDKSHAKKFELENGIATNPHSIGVETLTSQKQNAKEGSVGHVLDGSYNVQNNNDKSDYSKSNGEENIKLSTNSGDSILKPNLVGQGSAVVQGSIGNGQSLSSTGQSIENKFNGFGLNGQTETQNIPELLYDVGKIGVTGGFQTASSYGVNQEPTFDKTQNFGVLAEKHGESNVVNHQSSVSTSASTSSVGTPNPGQQVTGSTKGYDGSGTTFGSGITNAFNTGNFNRAEQKSEDYKIGSYFLTSPFYPGYKVVDNRQKLSGYEGVKFSTNTFPLKAAPVVNFQGLHFPIKNDHNLDLKTPISPQYRQHQGLTTSHYNVITQTYVPSFTSTFRKPSTNFGRLSSNQGSFSSNGNQDSFPHKSIYLSDQKPLVQSQSNQKSAGFSGLQTQFSSTSSSEFLEEPLTIGIPTPTPAVFEKKPEAKSISDISSGSQNNQFGFPFRSINNAKSVTTDSSSSSYNFRSEGQSTQKSQSNIKPFVSPQSTGSRFSQIQFGNTFGSQSSLNSQKGIGSMSSTPSQVQHITQKDENSFESQPIHKSFQQFQYSSISGSQFGKNSESTWKTSQTSHSGPANEKTQFGFPSSSLNSAKSGSTQSISSTYNGGSKGQSVQSSQISVTPSGSSQSTGFGSSQTQFGNTFGSRNGLNSQKVVGSNSSTTYQVQQNSQKDVKQSGLQDSLKYSHQTPYSSTTGSHFGKKPELTTTISHTFPVVSQKKTGSDYEKSQLGSTFGSQSGLHSQKVVGSISSTTSQVQQNSQKDVKQTESQESNKYSQQSQYSSTIGSHLGKKPELSAAISHTFPMFGQKKTGSDNDKSQISFSSSSLNSEKPGSTQSISSSYNGGSKGQSVQSSKISVKPFGSLQSTGFDSSQTRFGSTFGSQSGLNSQKVVGSISSTTSQVQQNSQKDVKQTVSQESNKYSQQSQYSSKSGSQFGKKPESTGTISHTFPVVGQKATVTSQTNFSKEKPHFGFTSSSLTSAKSGTTYSSSSSYNGGAKDQSVQTSQSSVKPFGFLQHAGFGSSQTQFGSTFGSQSGLNSQKIVGSISSTTSQVQQNSQKDVKQSGSQESNKYSQQSQYSSTTGSHYGKKPELTTTISHTFPVFGQKKIGSDNDKSQFSLSSSSLNSEKPGSTQSISSSYNGGSKGQSVQSAQISVKPFGSFQSTGFDSSRTRFGSTFGSQSGLNSQKVVGSISSTTSQVQQNSQKDVKQSGLLYSLNHSQQSQYSSTSGSQFGKKPESTGTISHTFPVVGPKTTVTSQKNFSNEKPHFGFTSSSLTSARSVTTHSSFSSYNGGAKDQSVQTSQSSVKPFGSSQHTGFGSSQTRFGSMFGSHSDLNSQKIVGSISSTTSQVQQNFQKDVKQSGSQGSNKYSQQSQYSLTSESQFGKKPELTATISHTFPVVGQKKTDSHYEKSQLGSTFGGQSSLHSQKVVGSISSTTSQVQQNSQKDVKQTESQVSDKYSKQSQYSSTIGKKPELTATISHMFPVFGQKKTGSDNEKSLFGYPSSSLNSEQPRSTQSISSSYNGGSKGQSVQSSQISVKPFGSLQSTGFGSSQTQFGSTFGSQSGLNSRQVVSSISSTTPEVQQNSQKDVKQLGLQDSLNHAQQSQYSSTFGTQFGKKPELTATISHTFPVVGQKKTDSDNEKSQLGSTFGSQSGLNSQKVVSHTFPVVDQKKTDSDNEKTQLGFSSTLLNSDKSGSTQSTSSSYSGKSKSQSVQSSQLSRQRIGSSQSIGSGFSQTQLGSTFGTQSSHLQKVLGTKNSVLVQPISEYRKKPFGSQPAYNTYQQSQYSSTTRTEVGSLPESNLSHISTIVGQKSLGTLQTGSGNENTQFGKSTSSLPIKESHSTESNFFSVSSVLKDQAEHTSQFGSKPFVYPQTTGSSFSKTHLGSTFGSTYDKPSFGRHYGSYQDTPLGLVTGSQGLSGQIHSVKPYSYPQITGSGSQQPHLSFSLRDLLNHKPQSTFSQSYTSQGYNTANKPFDSIPTPLHRHSGVGIGQNHESAASTYAISGSFSNTQTKYQTTNFGTNGRQPSGGSLSQTVHKQTKVFGLTPSTDLLSVAHSNANTVPGAQIPISVTEKSSDLASFIGKGETFGGPRDPPSFDIKTGYHY